MSDPEFVCFKLIDSLFVPNPVPVTVMSVPPALPEDGEMETRVGAMEIELKESKPVGNPSGK